MSDHRKILRLLKELKKKLEVVKVSQSVKIKNDIELPEDLWGIKEEIQNIEAKLDNPCFGLVEIKKEIKDIEAKLDKIVPGAVARTLTTGPVIRDGAQAQNLIVKVLNNTKTVQTVTISVLNLGQCPKTLLTAPISLALSSKCAKETTVDLGIGVNAVTNFEVQISGVVQDVFAFVSTQVDGSSNLQPSNTFRHEELVPTIDP